jgi:hypothetical protein
MVAGNLVVWWYGGGVRGMKRGNRDYLYLYSTLIRFLHIQNNSNVTFHG